MVRGHLALLPVVFRIGDSVLVSARLDRRRPEAARIGDTGQGSASPSGGRPRPVGPAEQ